MTQRLLLEGPGLVAEAGPGQWVTVRAPDPDGLLDDIAGTARPTLRVVVDDHDVGAAPAHERVAAGLQVVASRLPALVALRVVDVVLLGAGTGRLGLWQTLLGTDRARHEAADQQAAARSLGGRVGLGRWLDVPAVGLDPGVAALTDLARALFARPRAIVWRRPQWLAGGDAASIAEVLACEQQREGFAVAEVTSAADPDGTFGAAV